MSYKHGIRIQENPTSLPTPVSNEAGVHVIFGTAPINLVADPEAAVNKLYLVNSFAEAVEALGYSEDYASYTLCAAMDAYFKAFPIAPVVLCNVLDPTSHKAAYTETITVAGGIAKSTSKGVIKKGLTAKDGSDNAMTLGTDYTLAFDSEGYLVVTVLDNTITTVKLAGYKLDPTAVVAADVIGAHNSGTGVDTGIQLVDQVYPQFNLAPGVLSAPGWSYISNVGLALAAKCRDISGMFRAIALIDLDCGQTVNGAKKFEDVETVKANSGFASEDMIVLWPCAKYAGKVMPYSALKGAQLAYEDANNDNVPNISGSNHSLRASAAVLADGTEVNLYQSQANELNGVGVVTILNLDGIKSWGNNTAVYPDSTDPKDRWIACRRFFSWWGNGFIMTYLSKVDSPANYRLIESIVSSENVRANSLVSTGKCAGLRMEYRREDNPIGNVIDGKIKFRQYLAPYTPAEDILNVLEFDPSMIEAALGGE